MSKSPKSPVQAPAPAAPAASAASAASAADHPPLKFPIPEIFNIVSKQKQKDRFIIASLPKRFINILAALNCTICGSRFSSVEHPFSAVCGHMFCLTCSIENSMAKNEECPICDRYERKNRKAAMGDPYYKPEDVLLKMYGWLQNGNGYRCNVCIQLHPRGNVVRCTSVDCNWEKEKVEKEEEERIYHADTSEKPILHDLTGGSIDDDSPRTAHNVAHRRHVTTLVTYRVKDNRKSKELPRSDVPLVVFNEEEEGEVKKRKISEEEEDLAYSQPCSSKSTLSASIDRSTDRLSRLSIDPESIPAEYRNGNYVCVWCANDKHRQCKLVAVEDNEVESPRARDGEMLRSIDPSLSEAWSFIHCNFCWTMFSPNLSENIQLDGDPRIHRSFGSTAIMGATPLPCGHNICVQGHHTGCFSSYFSQGSSGRCYFCHKDMVLAHVVEQPIFYLNDLLDLLIEHEMCTACKRSHPKTNIYQHGTVKRCMWCELEWFQRSHSNQ